MSSENYGIASLRGISLASTMLDLVTVAPIQFGNYHTLITRMYDDVVFTFPLSFLHHHT